MLSNERLRISNQGTLSLNKNGEVIINETKYLQADNNKTGKDNNAIFPAAK